MDVKTKEDLDAATAQGKVLVDFWAPWCGPCRAMGEVIEREVAPAVPGLEIVKVNVDEAPELAAAFGVVSIPALFCFKDGAPCGSFVGVTGADEIGGCFV